jgi:hypothetical protein
MDDLELLGRSEDDLDNEIKIVKANSKATNRNLGLEKCARIRLTIWRLTATLVVVPHC